MQSQGVPGHRSKNAFVLARTDTPHPSVANINNGGGKRASSPDLGARSKHPQARGMAVKAGSTLGKGQRKKMKPNLIKTSMDGAAKWSAAASPQKKTQISLAKKATNVQIQHAKKSARQKRANAKKQKPAAKKRNGVLVLTEDTADADKKLQLEQAQADADEQAKKLQLEQAQADKTKAKADALAEKQAAKQVKADQAKAKKEQARQAKEAEKAETAREALLTKQLEEHLKAPPPAVSPQEFPDIDIRAEDPAPIAGGTASGGVGRNLLDEMDEREETLKAVADFIAGGKASKVGGVRKPDPKAREGPGNGGFWKPNAKPASPAPAKGGSRKAKKASAAKLGQIKRFKAGRDCGHELENYNLNDPDEKLARDAEYNKNIAASNERKAILKERKDEAKFWLEKAKNAVLKNKKNEDLQDSLKDARKAFKKAEAAFKKVNLRHDLYVMKTNFARGGGEDGFACDNHLLVYQEYVALLKTGKSEWKDLQNAKATASEEEASDEHHSDEEDEEDEEDDER